MEKLLFAKSDLLGLVKGSYNVPKPPLPEGNNHHTRRQCYFPERCRFLPKFIFNAEFSGVCGAALRQA